MAWWNSVGVRPHELAVKSGNSDTAFGKFQRFIDRGGEYYGNVLGVEEVTGKPNISFYDGLECKMRKAKKSTIFNYRHKTMIIRSG